MAVLEAFVYDPLITWRLIQHDGDSRRAERMFIIISQCLLNLFPIVMNPDRNVDVASSTTTGGGTTRRTRPDENDIFNGKHSQLYVKY